MTVWPTLPAPAETVQLLSRWDALRDYRARVLKSLEDARSAGEIGAPLQAELILHVNEAEHALLAPLGEDLRFVFIVSRVELVPASESAILVVPSTQRKCERCWHYRADTGHNPDHPELCGRCTSNLFGTGEVRHHA
jgi:isoleucyl-tRNA synthetase